MSFANHTCTITYSQNTENWILYDSNQPHGDVSCKTAQLDQCIKDFTFFNQNITLSFLSFEQDTILIQDKAMFHKAILKDAGFHRLAKDACHRLQELSSHFSNDDDVLCDMASALVVQDKYSKAQTTGAEHLFMYPMKLDIFIKSIQSFPKAAHLARQNFTQAFAIKSQLGHYNGAQWLLMHVFTHRDEPTDVSPDQPNMLHTLFTFLDQEVNLGNDARKQFIQALLSETDTPLFICLYALDSQTFTFILNCMAAMTS